MSEPRRQYRLWLRRTFCFGVRSPCRKTVTLAFSVQLLCSEASPVPPRSLEPEEPGCESERRGTDVLQNDDRIEAHCERIC
jgi:hypothetical protein